MRLRHGGARLLLADDNEINPEAALELLQRAGLIVEIAWDGCQAVGMARARPWAIFDNFPPFAKRGAGGISSARLLIPPHPPFCKRGEERPRGYEDFRRSPYDLGRMDLQMPAMSGLEAAQAIRGLPGREWHPPIVAMTATAFGEDRLQSLQAGMHDFVPKPVDPPVMYATLLKWLEGREARQGPGSGPDGHGAAGGE